MYKRIFEPYRDYESECYKNFVCSIIYQAVLDLESDDDKCRKSAIQFFGSKYFDFYCALVDMNPTIFKKKLKKYTGELWI